MEFVDRIDRSLARGLFRQELREDPALVRRASEPFPLDSLAMRLLGRYLGRLDGKMHVKDDVLRDLHRAMGSYEHGPGETLYSSTLSLPKAGSRRSWLEFSCRQKPVLDDWRFMPSDQYVLCRRDMVVIAVKHAFTDVNVHAVERYLQRSGNASVTARNVAPVISELSDMTDVFAFLAAVAGARAGRQMAVPFRDGLVLCRIENEPRGAWIRKLSKATALDRGAHCGNAYHSHPLMWTDAGSQMRVSVKTFIGPSQMKESQKELHGLLSTVRDLARARIAPLGLLAGSFYPGHQRTVWDDLSARAEWFGDLVKGTAEAISDRGLGYAFTRDEEFSAEDASDVQALIARGERMDAAHAAETERLGHSGKGGGLFCHGGEYALALAATEETPPPRFVKIGLSGKFG